jgi:hypothetical protein
MSFIDFNSFEKDTVILNSDRVILNSKDDSVFVLSKKTVGVSAVESVHFNVGLSDSKDMNNKFVINAPYIQLGLPSRGNSQPIAKGDSVVKFIDDLISYLDTFSKSLSTATATGVGVAGLPQINVAAANLSEKLSQLKTNYGGDSSPIKSKVSKTI